MTKNKKSFKKIGNNILSPPKKPSSMEDFLNDKDEPIKLDNAQIHKTTSVQIHIHKPDARLHVFIEGTLNDKLMDEVYRRKKDNTKNQKEASKRRVIEDALNAYFN